jgi:hypothetical protein
MPMNRNIKANRMCDDWTFIFLHSVLQRLKHHLFSWELSSNSADLPNQILFLKYNFKS